MKKLILLSAILILTNSYAGGIACLDAAGYYGTMIMEEKGDGEFELLLAQGFGFELSENLKLPIDAHSYRVHFEKGDCKISKMQISCDGFAQVRATSFTNGSIKFGAEVDFSLSRGNAKVKILTSRNQEGSASHIFGSLSKCNKF